VKSGEFCQCCVFVGGRGPAGVRHPRQASDLRESWGFPNWLHMILEGRVPACATILGASWNRSNFFWVTFQYRRRKSISVASNGSEVQSMIESELSLADVG